MAPGSVQQVPFCPVSPFLGTVCWDDRQTDRQQGSGRNAAQATDMEVTWCWRHFLR